MWNSWVEREVITKIKENVDSSRNWFHLRLVRKPNDRDRMENEELYTSLAYLEFEKLQIQDRASYLDIYQKNDRINARIRSTTDLTNVLTTVSEKHDSKKLFLDSIKNVESFIAKVKLVLLDKDMEKSELSDYLTTELDFL